MTADKSSLPMFPRASSPPPHEAKPPWLKVRLPGGSEYLRVLRLMREQRLHTVCEEARCPNMAECWSHGTATLMLLGDTCTRACGFCAVRTGRPTAPDEGEPERVAQTVHALGLRHAVLTAVTRDDLPDGGAQIFAESVGRIRELCHDCAVEVLVPDFAGNWEALSLVVDARPDVFNHNTETVPRLYGRVRPRAVYARSLELLRRVKRLDPGAITKSGLMVGLGEDERELSAVFADLAGAGVDVLTLGQYLRPSSWHLPVVRYYTPEEFRNLQAVALSFGFRHVEAGPLVRSSYHAHSHVSAMRSDPPES